MGIILMKYKRELIKSMSFLGKKKNTIFIGQSVSYSGNAIYNTLIGVSSKKKLNYQFLRMFKWVCQLEWP